MIQFNLLPDVKLEYIKSQKTFRLVTGISVIVTLAAIAILLVLLVFEAFQGRQLNSLTSKINGESSRLQNIPQINKILTVQNQIASLNTLHNQKPAVDRLFKYLNELTPNQLSINNLNIDFTANTGTLSGTADSIATINKFIDTLKFTTYTTSSRTTVADNSGAGNSCSSASSVISSIGSGSQAFNNVVLNNFGVSSNGATTGSSGGSTFQISFGFDPNLFNITETVNLYIPNIVTTRSCIDQPNVLFTPGSTINLKGTN